MNKLSIRDLVLTFLEGMGYNRHDSDISDPDAIRLEWMWKGEDMRALPIRFDQARGKAKIGSLTTPWLSAHSPSFFEDLIEMAKKWEQLTDEVKSLGEE